MKKLIFITMAILVLSNMAFAVASNRIYYHIDIVDEFLEPVTTATQIDIQDTSGSAVAVYSTKSGSTEVGSTGVITSGISDGRIEFWYADTAIDITVTTASASYEIESFSVRDVRFMMPRFLPSVSSTSYGQTDDIDFTYASWIIDGDTTNRLDMIPDNDGGILGIGDGTTQADVYVYGSSTDYLFFDEGNVVLNLVDVDLDLDDDADLSFGSDDDFTVDSDTANTLDVLSAVSDETGVINFGADQTGIDVKFFGASASTYALWDASADELLLILADLKISQGSQIEFIDVTDGLTDWTIDNSTDETLLILPVETTDDQSVNLGNATYTTDFRLFGATASTVVFDASGDEVIFDAYDISLQDGDFLKFGDDDDWTIDSSTTKILDIVPATTDESSAVYIGADQAGADLKVFGATTGEYVQYDASTDTLSANTGNISWVTTDAEVNQWKIDATGTGAGYVAVIETTDGGVQINADGASNGDIDVDAADDMTLTAAGDMTVTVTGTLGFAASLFSNFKLTTEAVSGTTDVLTASQSGSVIVYTMTSALCSVTLPDAAAGLWFILMDGNPTAGRDLSIDPQAADSINGDTAGNYIKNENDRDGEGVLIFAVDGTNWYALEIGSSTVWTEE